MRLLTLLLLATAALALGACGGDSELVSESPRTTPDLTIPSTSDDAGDAEAGDEDTSTTSTTSTDADDASSADPDAAAVTPDASGGTAAPVTPAPTDEPAAPEAGGEAAPTPEPATPEGTGGAEAGGASADFCANNPGAC